MLKGIEYHGRLARRDGRPANPGIYDLQLTLHPDAKSRRVLWTEDHDEVEVNPGGFFNLILGLKSPIEADLFGEAPLYMAVRIRRKGELAEELAYRVPMTALPIQLLSALERLEQRMAALEERGEADEDAPSTTRLSERIGALERQLNHQAASDFNALAAQVEALALRVEKLDADDGRLDQIEDRLEDVDGEDGDLLDLYERVEDLEKLFASKQKRR